MKHLLPATALLLLTLSGCATLPPTRETPQLPPSVFGGFQDDDIGAINLVQWAFASAGRLRGRPVEAARAVIAVEYLAGELRLNPRWVEVSPITKQEMVQARDDLHRLLGIAPGTPPQQVVNVLLTAVWNLQQARTEAALQALAAPGFTLPPDRTLQVLADLPYLRSANLAGADAGAALMRR